MKEKLKNSKGITLIALVVTIIVLIILAGVGINLVFGQNGLIERAKNGGELYSQGQAKEKLNIALVDLQVQKNIDIGLKYYNEDEYITDILTNKGMEVNGDLITVDGWLFLIDRATLQIIEELGKEKGEKPQIAQVPIIESNYAYPIITEYGVRLDGIKIIYDTKEGLENYYSIDNGTTWNKYTGPFQILGTVTVKAKSVKNGNILSETSQEVTMPIDALPSETYDGNDDTYVQPTGDVNYYINIDSTMKNKKIRVYMKSLAQTYCIGSIYTVLEDGTEQRKAIVDLQSTFNSTIEIPENAVKLRVLLQKNTRLYEIGLAKDPEFNICEYPILTQDGVVLKNDKVTINYHKTSVTKLYSLDSINWKIYNEEEIELTEGQTIYAKGIDQEGNETRILSYTSEIKEDIIGSLAYDNKEDTYFKGNGNYYMDIDSSMLGKSVRINMKSTQIEYGWGFIYIILDDGTKEEKIRVCNNSSFNSTIDIPENATRILYTTQQNVVLYEIEPVK